MNSLAYTVPTSKDIDEAIEAIKENASLHGFRILHIHDIAATLAEKGFAREPMKIVEVCNAKYAHDVLEKDPVTALMLPCPIVGYQQNGKTNISPMLPSVMAELLPGRNLEFTAELVEFALLAIGNQSAGDAMPVPAI